MSRQSSEWLIPIFLAVGAGVALWYYWMQVSDESPEVVAPAEQVVEAPAELPGPLHPVEPIQPEPADPGRLVPLPSLDESDEYLKLEISSLFGVLIEEQLAESGIIERLVATIDNLPRSRVAERIRPLGRLDTPFLVDGQDSSGEYSINTDNYRRYDALVQMAVAADLDAVVDVYRRYYPLFQSAYVGLGYPDGYFNDRLVEVIDHLLETPEVSDPVALVRPHVLYEFRDADLESLSGGQKLLLRIGGEHRTRIKDTLRELRSRVTAL